MKIGHNYQNGAIAWQGNMSDLCIVKIFLPKSVSVKAPEWSKLIVRSF